MRRCREASSTAALIFSPRAPQRSAEFVARRWVSRSAAESSSEPTAVAPARAEYAQSLFSVLKLESAEDALNRTTAATQLAASAAEKSWWTKYPWGQIAVKRKQPDCRFHELATGC